MTTDTLRTLGGAALVLLLFWALGNLGLSWLDAREVA